MLGDPPDTARSIPTHVALSAIPTWQRCPVCDGSGRVGNPDCALSEQKMTCPTCEGKRILSTMTGRPPSDPVRSTVSAPVTPTIPPASDLWPGSDL